MEVETPRREIAAALEASAQLLERMGGKHAHGAQLLRERLTGLDANRLRHRDAAIVALRDGYFRGVADATAAREIAKEIARYAASAWKRIDGARNNGPPEHYRGYPREWMYWIVALSASRIPGQEAIRKILARERVGKVWPLESARPAALEYAQARGSRSVEADAKFIATVKASPEYRAAGAAATEAEVDDRRHHIAAIKEIDAAAKKAWPREESRKSAAIEKVRGVELELKTANAELRAVVGAVGSERLARATARQNHEGALVAGDWPEIDAFASECRDELDKRDKGLVIERVSERNEVTGRTRNVGTISNIASIRKRAAAVLATLRELPDLKLIADRRENPQRIAAMRDAWPAIDDAPSMPRETP